MKAAWFCPTALAAWPGERRCVYSGCKHTDVTPLLWALFREMAG